MSDGRGLAEQQLIALAQLILNPPAAGMTITLSPDGRVLPPGAGGTTSSLRWSNTPLAAELYDHLCRCGPIEFSVALQSALRNSREPRRLVLVAIKIGKAGSLPVLVQFLDKSNSQRIAEDYLNSESPTLRDAAQEWARRRNMVINYFGGGPRSSWGSF